MGVNDRMFEPPRVDLARLNWRLLQLPVPLRTLIQRAGDALAVNDFGDAQRLLQPALAMAPGQADVLRLYGLLLARLGNLDAAVANFEAAIRAAPDDAMGYWQYAQVCEEAGNPAAALRIREQAVQRLPDSPMALGDLGGQLSREQHPAEALQHLESAVRLAPGHAPTQLKLGDALVACGRTAEGVAAIRRAIACEPAFGAAWLSLADARTVAITDEEAAQMRTLLHGDAVDESERTAIEFALARACEDRRRHDEAFALLVDANARRCVEVGPWDERKFTRQAESSEKVFQAPHGTAVDMQLGREVIFIVGMPRSGTTLVEQILAAHPDVQAAGERGELAQVLTEESTRLRRHYPDWVPETDARSWHRLGQRYLELTARLRAGRGVFTDKMPNNWQAIGAIRMMLPGARIVVCRRDRLENCWSCFKQFFPRGWEFTYDMQQLATFWRTFDRAASRWVAHDPARVREQEYEALTAEPEPQIRALLAFCGLPFDAACLAPHAVRRSVYTLSAAQVSTPIYRHAGVAEAYGALLDPLRLALGLPPAMRAAGA